MLFNRFSVSSGFEMVELKKVKGKKSGEKILKLMAKCAIAVYGNERNL